MKIKRLKSGFYALYSDTGEILNAALIAWDGIRGTNGNHYNINGSWLYYIGDENTVYYAEKSGDDARIWCPGSRLVAHCHRLAQIAYLAAKYDAIPRPWVRMEG